MKGSGFGYLQIIMVRIPDPDPGALKTSGLDLSYYTGKKDDDLLLYFPFTAVASIFRPQFSVYNVNYYTGRVK
jgi:hypothetical protein